MEAALETFKAHFSHLEDPRVNVHNQLHNLEDILILTILAVLCGANDWVEIEEFGKSKLEWLTHSTGSGQETVLELRNGIPSHDTLGRVFSLLDPAQLQDGFLRWISSLAKLDGEFLAVDGKTLRRAYETGKRKGAIHMVSAWGVTNHLVFGQLRTAEKSNEITAIPDLLKRLNLKGCTVSIDAMGTQTAIAAQIVEAGGDYTLSLKDNQATMHEEVKEFFETAQETGFKNVTVEHRREIDGEHGRIETRDYWLTPLPEYFSGTKKWKGLKGIGCVTRKREIGEKITSETAYYLVSYAGDIGRFAQSTRGHWGVENSLHWSLDVSFNEDQSRIRKGFAGENLVVIRHLTLNLLKQEKTVKSGIAAKRKRAGWDNRYLEKLLALALPAL